MALPYVGQPQGYLIEAMFNKKFRDAASIKELFSLVDKRYKLSTYEKVKKN